MFEQLLKVGELLINALPNISLRQNKRKSVAKVLGVICRDLATLLENGDTILRLFNQHQNGKMVNVNELIVLLEEQHYLIPRILSSFKKKDVRTVLSIKVPELTPIQVLLLAKSSGVKFYLSKFEMDSNQNEYMNYRELRRIGSRAKLEFPNKRAINRSSKQLKQIKKLVEKLRQFIIQNFEIQEIL